jgi:Arc/MetJ family transcription regulator
MSTRLQVIMDDAELEEIQAEAERTRLTVSEWVRQVLREARGAVGSPVPGVVREAGAAYRGKPRSRSPVLVDDEVLHRVMERYRFPTRSAAVHYALERAAEPPMSREEKLAMRGTGWHGDLDQIRSADRPPDVIEPG